MSNDELQRAIDDITSGSSSDTSAVASDGTATVSLPDDFGMQGGGDNLAAAPSEPEVKNGMDFETLPLDEKFDEKTGMASEMGMPAVGAMPPLDSVSNEMKEAPSETPKDFGSGLGDSASKAVENIDTNDGVSDFMKEAPSETPKGKAVFSEVPAISEDPELKDIEKKALLELYPLLEKMDVDARKKFDICMRVVEKVGEKGATSAALAAAKGIADEKEKGECLIRLVEAIDKI